MKCAICGVAEATHGNYCKTCLDRETWDMDWDDIEAGAAFYVREVLKEV